MQGTIVSWFKHRGFGFIRREDSSDREVFLHVVDCPGKQPLSVNTKISFDLAMFGGREKAVNVCVLSRVSDCASDAVNPTEARRVQR